MKREAKAKGLRCREGDLVRVAASTHSELIGAIALVQRLRHDGRWNVLLDRKVYGVAVPSGRLVLTDELSFCDGSLLPLANVHDVVPARFSPLMGDRHCPLAENFAGEKEGP